MDTDVGEGVTRLQQAPHSSPIASHDVDNPSLHYQELEELQR